MPAAAAWEPPGVLVATWSSGRFYPRGNLRIGGIGITAAQLYTDERSDRIGELVVVEVYENSPAENAGMEKGDVIMEIDGHKTVGEDFAYLIEKLLRGNEGVAVDLVIWRPDEQRELKLSIRRDLVVY